MKVRGWLPISLVFISFGACAGDDSVYIEFLWEKPATGSLARQQTVQFLTDGQHDHRVCVAANLNDSDVGGLVLSVLDASGKVMSRQDHPEYRGVKKCYGADLGSGGRHGLWTFQAKLGDGRTGSEQIEVDGKIEESSLYKDPETPYVVGRPNYDSSIPPEEWRGRLVWNMTVNAQGQVTHVDVVTAEGVGAKLRDRAIAAGHMSIFFPDQKRAVKPQVWQRELSFAPD